MDVKTTVGKLVKHDRTMPVCRDCANGFFVAEILSRYFPTLVNMHSYENGLSMHFRKDNWEQIQKTCRKKGFQLPNDIVKGTTSEEFGAAVALLELLYEHLTQKQIRRPEEVRTYQCFFFSQKYR